MKVTISAGAQTAWSRICQNVASGRSTMPDSSCFQCSRGPAGGALVWPAR